jgi:hypothetical protein
MSYDSIVAWLVANWFQVSVISLLGVILFLVHYVVWAAYQALVRIEAIRMEIAAINYRQHRAQWDPVLD